MQRFEYTTSEIYDVTTKMIMERLGIRSPETLKKYKRLGYLPQGKRIKGVRGIFFTRAQANKLIVKLGSKAPLFSLASESPLGGY